MRKAYYRYKHHLKHWWGTLSIYQKLWPLMGALSLWGGFSLVGGFGSDHFKMFVGILVLGYLGGWPRRVLVFLLPLMLTGIVYDSQRYWADSVRGAINVAEPYIFDKTFFGINTEWGRLTPNEFWQHHLHPVLDFITGLAYLIFIAVYTLGAAYFTFWLSHKGTSKLSADEVARRSPRMMWAFFWVNVIGYSTYYWYPAAPPWYVSIYGLGPANMAALPNPAGTIRFDEMLGTHFFTAFYGKSADVFGAVPSLHIAYPLIAALYAWQMGAMQVFTTVFFLLMCFSAVYLNHHYVLDVLWGSVYATLTWVVVDWFADRKREA